LNYYKEEGELLKMITNNLTTVQNKIRQCPKNPVIPANAGIYDELDLDSRVRGNDGLSQIFPGNQSAR